MEAVMLSVENLEPRLKAMYKQLAIFLDDVVIPTKVRSASGHVTDVAEGGISYRNSHVASSCPSRSKPVGHPPQISWWAKQLCYWNSMPGGCKALHGLSAYRCSNVTVMFVSLTTG